MVEMQSRLRLVLLCVRVPLRGALSRSGLWRKLSLLALLCGLCIVFYHHHITYSASGKITDSHNGNFLVAMSSLQSFTEISRQYSDSVKTSTPSRGVQTADQRSVTSSATSATALAQLQLPHVSTAGHTSPTTAVLTHGLTSEKTTTKTNQERNSRVVKSREKSRHFSEKAQPPRVLLLYGTDGYRPSHEIKTFLESHRIPHRTTSLVKGQLLLGEKTNSSSYSQHLREISILIIVSHFQASLVEPYLELCRARHLSLVWAVLPYPHSQTPKPHFSHLHASSVAPDAIVGMTLSPRYPFFYGRPGATGGGIPHGKNWTTFSLETSGDSHVTNPGSHVTNSGPLPVGNLNAANAWSNMGDGEPGTKNGTNGYRVLVEVRVKTGETDYTHAPVVLEDMGGRDGVRKIVLGAPVRFWLSHLMLLESVHQLSDGRLVREGRERMVMVDIDDIFLAPEGRRMRVDDVQVRRLWELRNRGRREGVVDDVQVCVCESQRQREV